MGHTARLQSDLETTKVEREKLRIDLEKANEWHRDLEDIIDERQHELENLEVETTQQKEENQRLQRELQQADAQLRDARDHIFQLQPRRRSITEAEAKEKFDMLFASVQRWVQNRLDPILDELDSGKLRNGQFHTECARKLLALTSEGARGHFSSKGSDEYHVIAVVMQYLYKNFFNKSFYCPLDGSPGDDDNAMKFIKSIESAMRHLPRGELAVPNPTASLITCQILHSAEIGGPRR